MKSYICAIGTANPPHKIPQMQIADFMAAALQFDERDTRKLKALYRVSGIGQRYTVLEDYTRQNGDFTFYPNTPSLEPFPTVQQRMDLYKQHAVALSEQAIQDCLGQVSAVDLPDLTHLITVSCTGMYAPGLDIELVERLQLPTTVQRTAVNFMGCYAAFNAIKLADSICKANPEAKVMLVCTEICTIHFQKYTEQDHLVSNALFGDGAAAVLMQGQPCQEISLELQSFHCDLAPAGKREMAWHIGDTGFEMTLSSYVPDLIKKGITELTEKLLRGLKTTMSEIKLFAIHPGGRRILEVIEQELGMSRDDNRHAYKVLREFGNMSSATVLFVLKELMENLTRKEQNEPVLSFAFGPGLTLESMLLKVHYAGTTK
ncbi:putative naringenin-chalcone synthase [Pontibacter ummariensis]|uniref:Predicted naringenin-chalcone synthase n=1 Tax=Pontibacter ummariensis TaxID=1610492 RepID=A0A239L2V0_9BACT|nr:type III polyketide synthase [Pontibacter ummariensis]PRY04629.1 putative naringenin-chalcone synthase [Pontibacter ummariensis]SNT23864.1 Predicted naringenin-chalcone synthase [Pontibacter ummariensis]